MLWPGEHDRSPEEGRGLEEATGNEEAEEAALFPGRLSEIVGRAEACPASPAQPGAAASALSLHGG